MRMQKPVKVQHIDSFADEDDFAIAVLKLFS
jgi:hypothetical protein